MMRTTNTAGHSSSAHPMQKTSGRRGTLFHYTLVYMTIASAILSVAGVILHSVLKADASDRRESLFLSSLSRAEQQLRKDSQTNAFRYRSETWITTAGGDDSTIDWVIDLGILNRKVSRGDAVIATDRFIFPAGSQLRFQQASSDAVVVVISEPSALVKYQAGANGATLRNKPLSEAQPAPSAGVARPASIEIWLNGAQP